MTVKDRYNKTIQEIEEQAADPYKKPYEIAKGVARSNALILRDLDAVFKYMTGSTLHGYIRERKMMTSYMELIQAETQNIEQALAIAGYSDQQGYSKAFKARFGMPPGEAYTKKDHALYTAPLTWDAISDESASSFPAKEENASVPESEQLGVPDLPAEEENAAVPESTRFGIPEAQLIKAAEAMELEAFYGFTPLISQYAFDLADRIGRPLKDTFRFVDSFRDYVEQHSEAAEDPDAPEGTLITQEQILHEYGDSAFYQRMFFEHGIAADTIAYFQSMHNATEEELLECDPEMLTAYNETYEMSFHFFMRAWKAYMEHTGGKYDSSEFESYLSLLDSWLPIEAALENMERELSGEEIMDALYESVDPRDEALDLYYADIDETLEQAYTRWDGSRIDEEPDMDNMGYSDQVDASDMDAYTEDEGRLDDSWNEW